MSLKDFWKRNVVKDSTTLLSANVWAQGVSFAAYLVLARLFMPEDFSVYNTFYSYIEIFIILSTCKYELSIVIAKNDREAASSARLALRLNAWFSLFLLLFILMMRWFFPHSHISPISSNFTLCLLIPVMVFFCGSSRVYTFLFNRFRQFGQIAKSEIVTSTSGVLLKILFGLSRPLSYLHSVGLPLGTVLGKIAGNINYLVRLRSLNIPKDIRKEELRESARRYRNFPQYTMPKDLVNSISYNLPFFCLALYFEDSIIGLYSLALTFTLRPINLFNNAFEKALYPRISEKVRKGQPILKDLRSFIFYLNVVAIPLLGLAFLFAEPIFTFLFSHRWQGCGFYVRCLLPWVLVSLTSTSLMFVSNVFEQQRKELLFCLFLLALRAIAMVTGIVLHDFHLAILLFSLSGMLVSLLLVEKSE